MFYDDADFRNAYDPMSDFAEDAHSDTNVDVIVLQDTNTGPARAWYVDVGHNTILLGEWGEDDMGSPFTLRTFINYAKQYYPADRYLLAIYDHGGGWKGACRDDTNGGWLSMDEIHWAIAEAGGVDIICFTAPCMMGAVESAYELRDVVDAYVGSEELSGYICWWGIMGAICDVLNNGSELPSAEIGEIIVDLVEGNTWYPDRDWLTMSAVRSDEVDGVIQHVSSLASYLASDQASSELCATAVARDRSWELGMGGQYEYGLVDLWDFVEQYAAVTSDAMVEFELQAIRNALDLAIIDECHGPAQERVHGLTIYFPRIEGGYSHLYESCLLDFADNTAWDEFLGAYYDCPACDVTEDAQDVRLFLTSTPNPFQNAAGINFTTRAAGVVTLEIFDTSGRIVRTLCDREMGPGVHEELWDGRNHRGRLVPGGVYFCRLATEGQQLSCKMQLQR